jgi:F-type H+-transporting ATPase subunit b
MNTHAFLVAAETESPNPLLPETYDILWGGLSFLILLWLFWKFVLPIFNQVSTERAAKIEGGLARAKELQAEAERSKENYSEQLEAAAIEAAEIRTHAHAEGEQIVSRARDEATRTAADIAARADAQIDVEREAAVGSLQRDVGDLAIQLASKIVGESLSDDQRARATIDRFIADLESGSVTARSERP